MGLMTFQLPPDLPADLLRELARVSVVGGFDSAPAPVTAHVAGQVLTVSRPLDESGSLVVPWEVPGVGRLMTASATLIERESPYVLALELARGKVHQLRCHVAEWRAIGFPADAATEARLLHLSKAFGAAAILDPDQADAPAQAALHDAFLLTHELLPHYTARLMALRHQRVPRFDTAFGCQLPALPSAPAEYLEAFNAVRVPLTWRDIEPTESRYNWDEADAVVDWAVASGLGVTAGPLIDFSRAGLPDWLSLWEGDLPNLANFMCDYVETAVARYRDRIRRWQLASACNLCTVLNLSEDDMLWLTARLAEAALQMAPELEITMGVAQPWGEYLAEEEHTYTPMVFLDTLLRMGLRLAAIDLELVMGVGPRGSYCRDLLDVCRLLDNFAVLGSPINVTLALPSADGPDPLADPDLGVAAGRWREGYTPEWQAEWAASFAAMAVGKPYVTGVCWSHFNDAHRHRFPHCGLVDAGGAIKPALQRLRDLRATHLR